MSIDARVLADLLAAIVDGASAATRLHVEGESRRKGPRPGWLSAVTQIDVVGLHAGSVVIDLEAPVLRRELQRDAFVECVGEPSPDDDRTAIDLLSGAFEAASTTGPADVDLDRGMLEACLRIAEFARDPFAGVRLSNESAGRTVAITPTTVERLRTLARSTPRERVVRLAGRLTTISATRERQELVTRDGTRVALHTAGLESDRLRSLFDRDVVVEGEASFRPSGRIGLLRVDSIDRLREADEVFTAAPVVETGSLYDERTQTPDTGVGALFGTWPGDEGDEQLLRLLDELG